MNLSLDIAVLITAMTTLGLAFGLVWLRTLSTNATNYEAQQPPQAITALPVERDKYGHWTHPAWPEDGEENSLPKAWGAEHGLDLFIVEFENDAPEELADAYFEQGNPDCSAWQPSTPPGEGWFVFSIHDTEDGPVCVWVRSVREQQS